MKDTNDPILNARVSASYQTTSRENFYCKRCSKKLPTEIQDSLKIYLTRFPVICVKKCYEILSRNRNSLLFETFK